MVRLLGSKLRNRRLLSLPGIGHMGVLDRPDLVGPSIAEHLNWAFRN